MNETREPDYIEKGFQLFGKLNKTVTSSIDQANRLIAEQAKQAASQPVVQNVMASHGSMILIMAVFIMYMLFTSNYALDITFETAWLALPLLLLLAYGLNVFIQPIQKSNNWISSIFNYALFIGFSGLLIYYYFQFSQQTTTNLSYVYVALSAMLFFVSLAIVFYFLGEYIKRFEGFTGLVAQFLFYIPCLLLQFVSYMKKEFNSTTSTVFYLFVIQLVLILLYIYLPKIVKHLFMKKGIKLLPEALFLDDAHVISGSEELRMEHVDKFDQTPLYRNNYAISFWLYLNEQGSNYKAYSKETNIFNYANGVPHVVYENDNDIEHGRNNLVIYYTNGENKQNNKIKLKITKQKWNHFVFNYTSEYLDVFVNGKLTKSLPLSSIEPKFNPYDNITVGAQDGLDGAICNVNYYKAPLSKRNILNEYNLLAYKNPPIETKWIPKDMIDWNMLKKLFFLRID